MEIFLVRTHERVPEDGVISRPGSHSQEGSGGGVSRTTFFGGPVVFFAKRIVFLVYWSFPTGPPFSPSSCFKFCGFFLIGIAFF